MKIKISRSVCYITFDEEDGKHSGKTISFDGEGNNQNEFCIYKSSKMCWVYPTENPNHLKSVWADERDKNELIAYVLERANELGYSLFLW